MMMRRERDDERGEMMRGERRERGERGERDIFFLVLLQSGKMMFLVLLQSGKI